jgi:hypothetical protein
MPSVITPCGGGGGSSALVGARVRCTFDEGVPNSAQHAIPFDTTDFNAGVTFNIGQPTRLTIQTAGAYILVGNALFAANTGGQRQLNLALNGLWSSGQFIARNVLRAIDIAGLGTAVNVVGVWQFAVNDYVELLAFQSSGGSLAVLAADKYSTSLSAVLLGTV